jgi:hypothetical protein
MGLADTESQYAIDHTGPGACQQRFDRKKRHLRAGQGHYAKKAASLVDQQYGPENCDIFSPDCAAKMTGTAVALLHNSSTSMSYGNKSPRLPFL